MGKPNKNGDGIGAALLKRLKAFFTKNLALKIVSLLFAVMIWGYVMMDTNPERTKVIEDVPVSFSGETDLNQRGLAIRGDHSQILRSVTARVSTELTNYTNLDASDISATVNLRTVTNAGTYRLRINATSAGGNVESLSPGEVVIEVDQLATRVVPIEVEYSGELPEGYWKGEPTLGSQTMSVSGPEEDVSTVAKAICTIDLDGRTATCNESILLRYVDAAGNDVDSALFLNKLPSVVVRMDVLRMATLSVNAEKAVLGEDALPANYEVYDIVSTPPAVRVVGPDAAMEGLEGIDISNVDISGSTASLQAEAELLVPEGVTLLDEPVVTVYVDIREKVESEQFNDMAIEVRGLGRGYTAELSEQTADISVTGRVSLIRLLERGELKLYVDLTGLEPGQHQVDIEAAMPTTDAQTELAWTLSVPHVTATISG